MSTFDAVALSRWCPRLQLAHLHPQLAQMPPLPGRVGHKLSARRPACVLGWLVQTSP